MVLDVFSLVFRLFDCWIHRNNFFVAFAIASVVIDNSAGLQVGVDSSWTEEFKSALF